MRGQQGSACGACATGIQVALGLGTKRGDECGIGPNVAATRWRKAWAPELTSAARHGDLRGDQADVVVHGSADQRVEKAQNQTLRSGDGSQDASALQLVDSRPRVDQVSYHGRGRQGRVRPKDSRCSGKTLSIGGCTAHGGQHQQGSERGTGSGTSTASACPSVSSDIRAAEVERIPARVRAQPCRGPMGKDVPGPRPARTLALPRRTESQGDVSSAIADVAEQSRGKPSRPVLSGRQDHQDVLDLEPPHGERQRSDRRSVRLVYVVDDDHERGRSTTPDSAPAPARPHHKGISRLAGPPQCGWADSPQLACQLVHNAVAKCRLAFVCRRHDERCVRQRLGERSQEGCLPRPTLAVDEDTARSTRSRRLQ